MTFGLADAIRALRALRAPRRSETELDDELRLHLELETQANIGRGMSREAARRAALLSFGGVEQAKEGCRDSWGGRFLEVLVQDVRTACAACDAAPASRPRSC